jgi:pimeloyl-ACP methyl ester carboxylesterase
MNDTEIHWSVTGKGPKTVLFVHGWTCDERVWTEQIPALSKNHRVITMDLPCHGQSAAPAGVKITIDLFARAVETVRAQVGAKHIALVGHSMGALVAIRYALLYPQHAAALVIVDGVTAGDPNRHKRSGASVSGPDGLKNRVARIQGLLSPATSPEWQSRIRDMMLASSEQTAAGAMDAMREETEHDIEPMSIPTLAVFAHHSRLANPEYLHSHFINLEFLEMPGTGHFLMLEKPDDFNQLLTSFLHKQIF